MVFKKKEYQGIDIFQCSFPRSEVRILSLPKLWFSLLSHAVRDFMEYQMYYEVKCYLITLPRFFNGYYAIYKEVSF